VELMHMKGLKFKIADPLYTPKEINEVFNNDFGVEWDVNNIEIYGSIIIVTDHNQFKGIEGKLNNKIVYDGRYVLNENESKNFILLQPGRLFHQKKH
ncbi:MAG: UDP-glucose/GDP-mannose dehydrogenase family protein, partial [Candidatus Heimdallarchaeota archaeon]|nr:UDP-glucose/GDP-mannose dehydrogenase family protein [Candidatus Heimdallarchaeota archaeon]